MPSCWIFFFLVVSSLTAVPISLKNVPSFRLELRFSYKSFLNCPTSSAKQILIQSLRCATCKLEIGFNCQQRKQSNANFIQLMRGQTQRVMLSTILPVTVKNQSFASSRHDTPRPAALLAWRQANKNVWLLLKNVPSLKRIFETIFLSHEYLHLNVCFYISLSQIPFLSNKTKYFIYTSIIRQLHKPRYQLPPPPPTSKAVSTVYCLFSLIWSPVCGATNYILFITDQQLVQCNVWITMEQYRVCLYHLITCTWFICTITLSRGGIPPF